MILPVAGAGATTLVDFKTQTTGNAESPFLYNAADTTKYAGCGAAKRDGYWIIETKACSSIHATPFITGFDQTISPGVTQDKISIGGTVLAPRLSEINANLFVGTAVSFTPDSTKDGLKLTLDSLANTNLVQLSMVVFALREWTQGPYPIQGVYVDNFNVNVDIDGTVVAPANIAISVTTTLPITRSISVPNYPDVAATSFGHRFCGYNYIELNRGAMTASN